MRYDIKKNIYLVKKAYVGGIELLDRTPLCMNYSI